jgi:plasmid stabilization system protein ParE
VARVEIASTGVEDLDEVIRTLSLPQGTRARVKSALRPLGQFPLMGAELTGAWSGFRFLLGPWRWLLIVYVYVEKDDIAVVVTMQDARSVRSPTAKASIEQKR